ncbi:protein phosphatase 1 regulatory subunit 36-like isoform X2 [Lineus longissimus]|uniref:protein phosphatase 1 regulatory subunit 36-like isoform X2 n=1 Tax=Lineus longissimus TaxID=88925 RepID=UPI002B4E1BA4
MMQAARPATVLEYGSVPSSGKWTWKEETATLEFISNNPNADKLDKKKRGQKGGGHHLMDFGSKRNDRNTPSLVNRPYGQQARPRAHGLQKSAKAKQKQSEEEQFVTLARVKDVAYDMLSEVESVAPAFDDLFSTEQFDEFLVYLINYFQCFFEKVAHENKPNPMNIEPSVAELKYYENLCQRVEVAQRQIGQTYCILVLGLGLEPFHHMACGFSRVSATYTDRNMYETIYSFCSFVVWISFKRKEYETIRKEVGRILRSDTFNPAIRVKNAPDEPKVADPNDDNKENNENKEKEEAEKKEKKSAEPVEKLTPAEYRRLHPKRPAIKSIIHQRSPAVVSILPSPKEEANWLFRRTGALSPTALANINRDELTEENMNDNQELPRINFKRFKAGIIGEPLSQFNKMTLTPLGAENEEGEEEEHSGERRGSGITRSPDMSRQPTALSHATTEAFSDEDEE